jgi:hypothetical protein
MPAWPRACARLAPAGCGGIFAGPGLKPGASGVDGHRLEQHPRPTGPGSSPGPPRHNGLSRLPGSSSAHSSPPANRHRRAGQLARPPRHTRRTTTHLPRHDTSSHTTSSAASRHQPPHHDTIRQPASSAGHGLRLPHSHASKHGNSTRVGAWHAMPAMMSAWRLMRPRLHRAAGRHAMLSRDHRGAKGNGDALFHHRRPGQLC